MSEYKGRVDIREIMPHQDKYPTVQSTFESLKVGEKMELFRKRTRGVESRSH